MRLLILLVSLLIWAAPVKAEYERSRAWFTSLPETARFELQTNLILLGYYNAFADGEFGRGTYSAITSFQKASNASGSGILNTGQLDVIAERATKRYTEWGIDVIEDKASESTFLAPLALLTEQAEAEGGTVFSAPDQEFMVQTFRIPAENNTYATLFAEITEVTRDHTVAYKAYAEDRFVVAGKDYGYSFYTLTYNVGDASIGFSAVWKDSWRTNGPIAVTYLASHFAPISFLADPSPPQESQTDTIEVTVPTSPEQKPAERTPAAKETVEGEWIGAFFLPRDLPDAISFNGAIVSDSPLQFLRALKSRPDAKVLVLDSQGGEVDAGLLMAHEVRQRSLDTVILDSAQCYSACAFVFLAGTDRLAAGELGVHQIWNKSNNLESGQEKLSDVIEALDEFGVDRGILSVMLRTLPEDMHVFSASELDRYAINHGDPLGDTRVLDANENMQVVREPVRVAGKTATLTDVFTTPTTTTVSSILLGKVSAASTVAVSEVFRSAHGIAIVPKDVTVAIYAGPALYGDGIVPYRVDLFDLPTNLGAGRGVASVILNTMGTYVTGTLELADKPTRSD